MPEVADAVEGAVADEAKAAAAGAVADAADQAGADPVEVETPAHAVATRSSTPCRAAAPPGPPPAGAWATTEASRACSAAAVAAPAPDRSQPLGSMISRPHMYGLRTSGTTTDPSFCWKHSNNGIRIRGLAMTVLLSVWQNRVFLDSSR